MSTSEAANGTVEGRMSAEQPRYETLRAALEAALPVLRRKAVHYDCDGDCWFSCALLTCDEDRKSDDPADCDCGATEAQAALALVEQALAGNAPEHAG